MTDPLRRNQRRHRSVGDFFMPILAMDLSTSRCSLALLDGAGDCSETEWEQTAGNNARFFLELHALLKRAGVEPAKLDGVAVGLGPGSFSGLRMSLTAAQLLALPGRRRVAGISSSKALAWDTLNEHDQPSVTVVGDARRGQLWLATYPRTTSLIEIGDHFILTAPERLADHVPVETVVASPDWSRIGGTIARRLAGRVAWVEEGDAHPTARAVGRLVAERWSAAGLATTDFSPQPLTPIYMQPPVEPCRNRR
ncbi:MAG: tRNA (adenosine(37)-N6)-threonylcarbamoyltransferase complex dimerization subunit type 1 TsaB [Verrucomicrobiota bacterium]|nr:tRNA (adenosine(37)-N6)-threonylcarbamoyltransferase complex dimerization subunit type 1 TsaB [Verrucomicrobiota bacterium]